MKYDVNTLPACQECMDANDAEETVKLCEKCGVGFCSHFASEIDIKYCGNCMVDVNFSETIVVKEQVFHNEKGAETHRRRQIAKLLKLSGSDWLFANKQIGTLTDEELCVTIEYHRAIANAMMLERETRKVEYLQKLRGVKVALRPRAEVDSTGAMKTAKIKRPKPAPTQNAVVEAIMTLLKAAGKEPTPEIIAMMMAQMTGEKK